MPPPQTTDLHDALRGVVGFISLDNLTMPSEDPIDTAEVRLINALLPNASLWGASVECYKCLKLQVQGARGRAGGVVCARVCVARVCPGVDDGRVHACALLRRHLGGGSDARWVTLAARHR